ncbi:MAG: tape measure protein [Opitutae bacterium]|nr:tape measure protein [Opitutae bacterium]
MADVNISIAANSQDFTAAIQQVGASVAEMKSSAVKNFSAIKSSVSGVADQISNLGVTVNQALGAVRKVASAVSVAWNAVTEFQDASVRLAPLVGGLEESRRLCDALRDSAANGTSSFADLTSVATRLSSVFSDSRSVENWTKRFHDLAAGTGADMDRVVAQFVKAKASGYFGAGFLDTLSAKGVNIYAPIAEQTGMAEEELRKLASAGQLSFSQIEAALVSLTSGTGQFAGAAQRMSETAGGSVRTLVAQVEILFAKFAEPIVDSITPIIQQVAAALAVIGDVAGGVGSVVSAVFGAMSSGGFAGAGRVGGESLW